MSLLNLEIAVDIGSIFTETVVVQKVQIDNPHATYDQDSARDNIQEFIGNVQTFIKYDPDAPKKVKKTNPSKEPKVVIVYSLEINDLQIHVDHTDSPMLDIFLGFEQFSLSMTNGTVQLKNFYITNPRSLATPKLFTLDSIDIKLDPSTIYSATPSIIDIQIIKPHAYLELTPETSTVAELIKISDRLKKHLASLSAPKPPEAAPQPKETQPNQAPAPPPVELHNLVVDDIQILLLDTTRTNASAQPATMASIESISVKLVEGALRINNITIPNVDAGFMSTNLLHLAGIDVSLDPASLYSDQMVIKEVFIDSPLINLEQTETTGNITELQKTAMGFVPPALEAPETPPASDAPAEETKPPMILSEQPVVLRSLLVTNFVVNMITPLENPAEGASTNALSMGLGKLSSMAKSSLDMVDPAQLINSGTEAESNAPLALLTFDLLSAEPLKGLIQIDNLAVGNPPGFANKNLVKLDQFRLDLDPDTLEADTMLIEDILIDKPRIAYERQLTTDNIKALQEFIKSVVENRAEAKEELEKPAEAEPETEKTPDKEAGQKVVINHLLVKDGLVKAKISAMPSIPMPLPDIEMNDIGKEEGGTSSKEALSEIGTTFYDAIVGSAASATGFAGDALKGAGAFTLGNLGVPGMQSDQPETEAVLVAEPAVEEAKPEKPKPRKSRRPGRTF